MTSSDQKAIIEQLTSERTRSREQLCSFGGSQYAGLRADLVQTIKSIDEVIVAYSKPLVVPMQLCPKCHGDGDLHRHNSPPMSTSLNTLCDVCNGAKVIPQVILKPEHK